MRTRVVLAIVLAAAVAVPAAGASAAPRRRPVPPSCNLLSDPPNDTRGPAPGTDSAFQNSTLDIVGGDIASDARNLTMVVKVRDLNMPTPDPNAPFGERWIFGFNIGLQAFDYEVSWSAQTNKQDPYGGTAVMDEAKNEIRMTMPLSAIGARASVKPKTKVTNLRAYTTQLFTTPRSAGIGTGSNIWQTDSADSTKTYELSNPSCVKVGQ